MIGLWVMLQVSVLLVDRLLRARRCASPGLRGGAPTSSRASLTIPARSAALIGLLGKEGVVGEVVPEGALAAGPAIHHPRGLVPLLRRAEVRLEGAGGQPGFVGLGMMASARLMARLAATLLVGFCIDQ